MESLRAFMLVTAVKDVCGEGDFTFDPPNVENDPSTTESIIDNGFHLMFRNEADRAGAIATIKTVGSVQGYQPYEIAPVEEKPAAPGADPAPVPQADPRRGGAAGSGNAAQQPCGQAPIPGAFADSQSLSPGTVR